MSNAVIFDEAFEEVVGIEGRYSNDPSDSGGETMYGITYRVARAEGYTGPMSRMPLDFAKYVYRLKYWDANKLDAVAAVAGARIAKEIFECAINLPYGYAGKFLQIALNAMNNQAAIWRDIPEDGQIGNLTLEALRSYFRHRGARGGTPLLNALNCQQGAHYLALSRTRQKDEKFIYGWFDKRVTIA